MDHGLTVGGGGAWPGGKWIMVWSVSWLGVRWRMVQGVGQVSHALGAGWVR